MTLDYPTIHRIKTVFGMPEFVKESEINFNPKGLTNQEYADPIKNKYPCNDATNTYISNAIFWEHAMDKSASVDVGRNLLKMARFWGILPAVRDNILRKVANAVSMSADKLPDNAYAVVEGDLRLYPVITADLVKESSDLFYSDRIRIPMQARTKAAKTILEKAASFKVTLKPDVQDYLEKAAALGISSSKHLAEVLRQRSVFLSKHAKLNDEAKNLEKAASFVEAQPTSKSLCEKVAALINEADEVGKLYQFYGDKLELPEVECFSLLMKQAKEEASKFIKLSTGTVYRKEDLEKIGMELFTLTPNYKSRVKNILGAFNKEAVAGTLKEMPRRDAELVEKVLDTKGIEPAKLKFDPAILQ